MEEPYAEGVANHGGPESCVVIREDGGEALTGVSAGRAIEPRNPFDRGADAVGLAEGHTAGGAMRKPLVGPARSKNQGMHRTSMRENREASRSPSPLVTAGPLREGRSHKPEVHEHEESDGPVVPAKPPNKATAAEAVEERGPAKGNTANPTRPGPRAGLGGKTRLDRVREVARKDKDVRFTALLHHVDVDRLREAYRAISPNAAPGVDGTTWDAYGEHLEANLEDLHRRVHSGAYRAKPSRRAYIPKADGRQRPLGIAALEDKVLQRAVVEVLNAIYEEDFLGFSYGFRPGRGPHDALDALSVGIMWKKVNWVLDADISDFFTRLDHSWVEKFLEHRIADRRALRLVQKWLAAGVIEDGAWSETTEGAPQGASVSPLLANVYLHYVFDRWVSQWRRRHAHGEMVVVRFADDFIVGFELSGDATQFLRELRERFAKFSLELHPSKTRLIQFGRFAAPSRAAKGLGKPGTFDFLGFTHICAKGKNGGFWVRRTTVSKRMRAKLRAVNVELKRRRHLPIPLQGQWLGSVVRGHMNYYAVPGNSRAVAQFRKRVAKHWLKALRRRSQRSRLNWERMSRLQARWLPPARVLHPYPTTPYPTTRFAART